MSKICIDLVTSTTETEDNSASSQELEEDKTADVQNQALTISEHERSLALEELRTRIFNQERKLPRWTIYIAFTIIILWILACTFISLYRKTSKEYRKSIIQHEHDLYFFCIGQFVLIK